jgi:hypothetical protein
MHGSKSRLFDLDEEFNDTMRMACRMRRRD